MTALFCREVPVCSTHLQMTSFQSWQSVSFWCMLNFSSQLTLPTAGHSWANVHCALIWRQPMAKQTGSSQEFKFRNINRTFIWWWAHTVEVRGGKMAFLYMSKSTFHVTTSTSLCGERGKFKKEKTGSRKRNPIKQLMYFLLSFQSYHLPGASDLQYDNKMEIVLKTAVVHLAFTLSRSYTLHPHKFNTSEMNSVIIPILQMTKPSRQHNVALNQGNLVPTPMNLTTVTNLLPMCYLK